MSAWTELQDYLDDGLESVQDVHADLSFYQGEDV